MSNPNFDTLLSTTLNNHRSTLVDNIFTSRPLFWFLQKQGNIVKEDGGVKIVIPLIHAASTAVGSFSNDDALTTTHQGGLSAAEYNWKQFYASVNLWGIEEAQNNGEEKIISLFKAKVQQAEESIKEALNQQFYGDGTGNAGKNWNGLGNLVNQNATAVGGIDPAANTYWQSYRRDGNGGVDEALTTARMATAYNTCSEGNDQPQLVLTTQALYEKYESLLTPNIRYTNTEVADAGFQNLLFKGATVCYDAHQTAKVMNFLNMKYIKLVGHSDVWFKATPFVRPSNQDVRIAQILLYGNLTVSNRKRQGALLRQIP